MKKENQVKLLFIYNANSGVRNAILDGMHKVISPSTYACSLCDITFGVVSENKVWKDFRQNTELDMDFLHKDEFTQQYASKFGHKFTFPIVLIQGENGLEVLVSTAELNEMQTAGDLVDSIRLRT